VLLQTESTGRYRETELGGVGKLAVLGLWISNSLLIRLGMSDTPLLVAWEMSLLCGISLRDSPDRPHSLSRRQTVGVSRCMREDLHPRLDRGVYILGECIRVWLFLGLPEGMRLWKREDEEGLECPVRRLGRVVVLALSSIHSCSGESLEDRSIKWV
jgi:hypothetical protein